MASDVNVSYAEMQNTATLLQQSEAQINSDLITLKKVVDSLVTNGYVTDTSSQHFMHAYDTVNTHSAKLLEGLGLLSSYLNQAVAAYQQMESTLNTQISQMQLN